MSAHNIPSELGPTSPNFSGTFQAFHTPEGYLFGSGLAVPTDGEAGWAPGALFIDRDGSGVGNTLFSNEGTKASCDFNAIAGG